MLVIIAIAMIAVMASLRAWGGVISAFLFLITVAFEIQPIGRLRPSLALTYAQRITVGMLIATPSIVWQIVATGGDAHSFIGLPLLALMGVWLVKTIWSEGWSGNKTKEPG